jgi:hypothetical protein
MIAYVLAFLDSNVMSILWWVLGAGGLVGLVLLFLLYPVIVQAMIKIIGVILTEMLSTRLGCAILTAIVVGLGVSHMRGRIDNDAFAERTAQFEQQQKDRDARIAAETRAAVENELAPRLQQIDAKTDSDVKVFTDAMPPTPVPAANPFRVGNDACKLRLIAGLPPCGSERLGGVSQAAKRAAGALHHTRYRLPAAISQGPRPVAQGQ